ncbi:MAG: hypothetical protein H7Z16_00900 [Pyrinomonadaceae bacterium]|nr:hypothetical protein [Pyrinomonadaceae bacterium]
MTRHRIVGLTLPLILCLATLLIIIPGRGQGEKQPAKNARQFDENRLPIADYSAPDPVDPAERSKRQARGKKYNKSSWRVHPNSASDSMVRVDSVDPSLPAFPFEKSCVVVVGHVTEAHAYLSNDKTGIYSVFRIQVTEVLKNSLKIPLTVASLIEAEREGGRVRFPNGRLHLYLINEQDMPRVGLRYVLFLTNTNEEPNLQILTGYELREGKVYSLDNLPNTRKHENVDEVKLLSELRQISNL